MRTNQFGQDIPEIRDILRNADVRQYIRDTLITILQALDVHFPDDNIDDFLRIADSDRTTLEKYEQEAHEYLQSLGVTERIPAKLSDRANLIYSQIKPFLLPGKVLDIGCGDGRVGELLAGDGLGNDVGDGVDVMLVDTYEHEHIKECRDKTGKRLQFRLMTDPKKVPIEIQTPSLPYNRRQLKPYDNTLLLTVLHHSSYPTATISEAKRLTRREGRIIVIESVYGVSDDTSFGQLNHENQRVANIFFDHLYNRVIHYSKNPRNPNQSSKKVNVPFNFNTPNSWRMFFEKYGLRQEGMFKLGIDQPCVPEYHTLHVLRKIN
ncbi:MAG: methyltransferase domain-containing protein [Candidatus Woesearchaeota archaeon]